MRTKTMIHRPQLLTTQDVKGLTIKQAEAKYPDVIFRIMSKDGQRLFGTCDYRLDRVNVEVKKKIIECIINVG